MTESPIDYYRDRATQRVTVSVRIATDSDGRPRSHYIDDVRYGIIRDFHGQEFSGRIPECLSQYSHQTVSATVSHVGIDGVVYLKNIRARKS